MKKSLFIIFLLIALHCHGIRVGSLEYNIYDYDRYGIGMAEVSAASTDISGDITIPGGVSANGVQFNVTHIAKNGFEECRSLTSITLPPTITSIGNHAFYNCRSLETVSFDKNHESLTIGDAAFGICYSLKSIELPNNTTSIGKFAFTGCLLLTDISLPSSLKEIHESAFVECSGLKNVYLSSISDWCNVAIDDLEASPFSQNDNSKIIINGKTIEKLEIPSSVVAIKDYAFAGNKNIKEVVLNKELETIGWYAFRFADNISQIISYPSIPPAAGVLAFDGVNKDIPVIVPASSLDAYKQSSEWSKFTNFLGLQTETSDRFTIDGVIYSTTGMEPNTCAVIGSNKKNIVIPSRVKFNNINYSVKEIADNAFENSGLESIEFEGGTLTKIGKRAFANSEIFKITIPYGTETIGDEAFAECSGLWTVELPVGILRSIGNGAFNLCPYLQSISIPGSVTFLGKDAFRECTNLSEVTIANGLTTIRENTFLKTKIKKLIVPESVSTIGANAFFMCQDLEGIAFLSPDLYLMQGAFWWCSNLKEVCILADQLPSLSTNLDPFDKSGIKIYVNEPLFETLESDNVWKKQNIILREIVFTESKYQLIVGSVYGFGYEVHDSSLISNKVDFSSSNTGIFTYTDSYDAGGSFNLPGNYIVGKSAGSATLYARSSSGLTAECPVEVYNKPSDMYIMFTENVISVGDTTVLTILTIPTDALVTPTWTSDNPSVVEIKTVNDNGVSVVIEGVGLGEATITARDNDFNISGRLKVTVVPRAETLTLDPSQWSGNVGESFTIVATITPENAINKPLEWSSSNESVATVDNEGRVSILLEGTCVITAKTTDGSNLSAECTINSTSGIDAVTVNANSWYEIYNLQGILVKKVPNDKDLNGLVPGIYIMRKGESCKKIIIN